MLLDADEVSGRPVIVFVQTDGRIDRVMVNVGVSLTMAARRKGVKGFDGDCTDGRCNGSCRVVIDSRFDRMVAAAGWADSGASVDANGGTSRSRLACDVTVSGVLDGLTVHVPTRSPVGFRLSGSRTRKTS